jgi:hypothetical protein
VIHLGADSDLEGKHEGVRSGSSSVTEKQLEEGDEKGEEGEGKVLEGVE